MLRTNPLSGPAVNDRTQRTLFPTIPQTALACLSVLIGTLLTAVDVCPQALAADKEALLATGHSSSQAESSAIFVPVLLTSSGLNNSLSNTRTSAAN